MAPAQANSQQLRSAKLGPRKVASILQRHQLKFLNLGLVIYLCFGALLFELLGEFSREHVTSSDIVRPSTSTKVSRGGSLSLAELRDLSARRMWNITNRLNILYESNWTRLMLDELQEFERQLLDKLADEANQELAGQDGEDEEDAESKDSDARKKEKRNDRSSRNRIKSLKKSLIHSLSTITTVGFSERVQSSAGKLATVIYGLLGIPLLVCAVARTGKQLAHSTLNGLLLARHYCFSLPLHYLCCSCTLGACFRCLLWCCCCCCCSYLCCCSPSRKDKDKCCDSNKAPKLRLRKKGRSCKRRPQDGASRATPDRERQAAFVIGATSGDGFEQSALAAAAAAETQTEQPQKSVRFVGNAKKFQPAKMQRQDLALDYETNDDDDDEDDNEDEDEDESYYTQGVFLTSLSVLGLYLLLGAYFYANHTNSSLIDALFVCYSMLSTSKFAGQSAQSEQIYSNPRTLYANLNATTSTSMPNATESIESETIKWLYLLIGLNLISACGHFARLWLSNQLRLKECPVAAARNKKNLSATCNGQPMIGQSTFALQAVPDLQSTACSANELQLAPNAGQLLGPADYSNLANHQNQNSIYPSQSNQQQQQPQPQVDLSELFLVPSQAQQSAGELHFQPHPQPAGQTSDLSLTSDRSTDRGSLCQHHQHHQQLQLQHQNSRPNSNEPTSFYPQSVYRTGSIKRHHRHASQSLYLPPQTLDCGEKQQQQQLDNHFILPNELSCDEADEMDLILKGCINSNGSAASRLRSSSSSTQLSHLNGPTSQNYQQAATGTNNSNNSSSTLSRVRTSFDKHNGQDSSQNNTLNDGSNTISSTNSSRTVKLPHMMRSNQHIGFILAPEHQ